MRQLSDLLHKPGLRKKNANPLAGTRVEFGTEELATATERLHSYIYLGSRNSNTVGHRAVATIWFKALQGRVMEIICATLCPAKSGAEPNDQPSYKIQSYFARTCHHLPPPDIHSCKLDGLKEPSVPLERTVGIVEENALGNIVTKP